MGNSIVFGRVVVTGFFWGGNVGDTKDVVEVVFIGDDVVCGAEFVFRGIENDVGTVCLEGIVGDVFIVCPNDSFDVA